VRGAFRYSICPTGRGSKPAVKVIAKFARDGASNPSDLKARRIVYSKNLKVWRFLKLLSLCSSGSVFASSNQKDHRDVRVVMMGTTKRDLDVHNGCRKQIIVVVVVVVVVVIIIIVVVVVV
jgi:hypothetical protein